MTPPDTPAAGLTAEAAARAPAVSPSLVVLRRRPEFLSAARAVRQGTGGFLLQARLRAPAEPDPAAIRIGFTASKKVGNAVARNRAKRRLREVARAVLPREGRSGWDYVLVAKPGVTIDRAFEALLSDLHWALRKIHTP